MKTSMHTPIAELSPSQRPQNTLKAIVTLTWPYSSATGSVAFLLAEPDFRLRRSRGQVRVQFSGPSAKAISKSGIASGDEVILSLDGAEYILDKDAGSVPGRSVDFELRFTEKVILQFRREGSEQLNSVEIDHPAPERPPEPETQQTELAASLPPTPMAITAVSMVGIAAKAYDEWSSPAFIKRARTSYGSLYEEDPFELEDNARQAKRRKTTRLSTTYSYVSRSPSLEVEALLEDTSATDTEGANVPATISSMVDEGVQTTNLEAYLAVEALADIIKATSNETSHKESYEPNLDDQGPQIPQNEEAEADVSMLKSLGPDRAQHLAAFSGPKVSSPPLQPLPSDSPPKFFPNASLFQDAFTNPNEWSYHQVSAAQDQFSEHEIEPTGTLVPMSVVEVAGGDRVPEVSIENVLVEPHRYGSWNEESSLNASQQTLGLPEPAEAAEVLDSQRYSTNDRQGLSQCPDPDKTHRHSVVIGVQKATSGNMLQGNSIDHEEQYSPAPEMSRSGSALSNPVDLTLNSSDDVDDSGGFEDEGLFRDVSGNPGDVNTSDLRTPEGDELKYEVLSQQESEDQSESEEVYDEEDEEGISPSANDRAPYRDKTHRIRFADGNESGDRNGDRSIDESGQDSADQESSENEESEDDQPRENLLMGPPDVIDLLSSDDEEHLIEKSQVKLATPVFQRMPSQELPRVFGDFEEEPGDYLGQEEFGNRLGYHDEENGESENETRQARAGVSWRNTGLGPFHMDEGPATDRDNTGSPDQLEVVTDAEDSRDSNMTPFTRVLEEAEVKSNKSSTILEATFQENKTGNLVDSTRSGWEADTISGKEIAQSDDGFYAAEARGLTPKEENQITAYGGSRSETAIQLGDTATIDDNGLHAEWEAGAIKCDEVFQDDHGTSLLRVRPTSKGIDNSNLVPQGDNAEGEPINEAGEVSAFGEDCFLSIFDGDPDGDQQISKILGPAVNRVVKGNLTAIETITSSEGQTSKVDETQATNKTATTDNHGFTPGIISRNSGSFGLDGENNEPQSELAHVVLSGSGTHDFENTTALKTTESEASFASPTQEPRTTLESCLDDTPDTTMQVGFDHSHPCLHDRIEEARDQRSLEDIENNTTTQAIVGTEVLFERPEGGQPGFGRSLPELPEIHHELNVRLSQVSSPSPSPSEQLMEAATYAVMKMSQNSPSPSVQVEAIPGSGGQAPEDSQIITRVTRSMKPERPAEAEALDATPVSPSMKARLQRPDTPEPVAESQSVQPVSTRQLRGKKVTSIVEVPIPIIPAVLAASIGSQSKSAAESELSERYLRMSQYPEIQEHDASVELATTAMQSPAQHSSRKTTPTTDSKLRLARTLRTNLSEFTSLKSIRFLNNSQKRIDVIAIATSNPPEAQRAKNGPRHYSISFNVTDQTIAPAAVTEVIIFRPYKDALPLFQSGDAIILRHFQVLALKNKGFGLRSDEGSSWAVFKGSTNEEEMRGPPLEFADQERRHVVDLKAWYAGLDTASQAKLARANVDRDSVGKIKGKGIAKAL